MERLLSAVLNGERTRWPFGPDERHSEFLAALSRHGIQSLVARQVRRGILVGVPEAVARSLARSAVQQMATEEVFAAELRRVLAALSGAGVPALLMKGSALAYTHYPHPCLRPRTDTDLMLRRDDLDSARRAFEYLGYAPFNAISGELVSSQCTWLKADPVGIRHVYDLHWKIANPRVASELLAWAELEREAVAIPTLGPGARGFCSAHALLLACVHRLAHHFDDDRMLWLYDVHLLHMGLGAAERGEFMRVASDPVAAAMCLCSLSAAASLFGTPVAEDVVRDLDARADPTAAAAFTGRTRRVDVLLSDFKALPGWRERLRLLREHLVPSPEFMRRQYGVTNPLLLPALYVWRWASGARQWFRPIVP